MAVNALVVGTGGREHALCDVLVASPLIGQVYCVPGNAGIRNRGCSVRAVAGRRDCFLLPGARGRFRRYRARRPPGGGAC